MNERGEGYVAFYKQNGPSPTRGIVLFVRRTDLSEYHFGIGNGFARRRPEQILSTGTPLLTS
jgi:hypothetical protein